MNKSIDSAVMHAPVVGQPMRVVVFASGGGGNLAAAVSVATHRPDLVAVEAVVTDRLGIPAIDIARYACIPVVVRDFESTCGRWRDCRHDRSLADQYRRRAIAFHEEVLRELLVIEQRSGWTFDLAVLSYRRWIHGALLDHFRDRMINQHAGDLSVVGPDGRRTYVGLDPVTAALHDGVRRTRTSTIVVTEGHDTGEILCQGPWVPYPYSTLTSRLAREHEQLQKERSDWPSLRFSLRTIAEGRFALGHEPAHQDGKRRVYLDGQPLPYTGVSLDENGNAS